MSKYLSDKELDNIARKRVKQKKGFYIHLQAYVLANIFFTLVSFINNEPFELLPIALIWGVSIAIHYLAVFGVPGLGRLSHEWESKEYEKERERLERQQPKRLPEERTKKEGLDLDDYLDRREYRPNYDEQDIV